MNDDTNFPANGAASPPPQPEPLLTIARAAGALNVHVWALQRAVKRGEIPSYTPFNSRKLVRLSEVLAFVEASRAGGANDDHQ